MFPPNRIEFNSINKNEYFRFRIGVLRQCNTWPRVGKERNMNMTYMNSRCYYYHSYHNIRTSTHLISPHYFSRAIHAAAAIHPPPAEPSNAPPSPHWLYDLQDIHDKLVHSFQNRQVYSLKGFIYSFHAQIELPRPFPPTPVPSCSNPCPHALHNSALSSPVIRLTGYT